MTHSIRARNSSLYNSSASSMQPTGFICLHSTVLNQERIHHSLFLSFPPLLPLPPPTSPSQDHSIPVAFPRQLWNGIRVLFLVFSPSPPFWHSLHYYLLGGVQDRFRWRWGMGWEVLNSWSLWNIRSGLPCRVFCCCWCRGNIWDGFHFRIVCILICFAGRGLLRDFWSLELRCGILRIAGSVRHFDNLFGVSKCSIISGLFQDLFFLGGGDLLPCYGAVGILSLSSKMGIFWGFWKEFLSGSIWDFISFFFLLFFQHIWAQCLAAQWNI